MAALPYMPFYPADYFADAHHLTTVEHGAYFLLIVTYWMRGEPLPDDDRKLAKIVKLTPKEWAEVRLELADFFDIEDGVWKHSRIERDLAHVAEKVEKASRAGRASAQRRSNGRSTDDELPFDERGNGEATNQSQSQSQTEDIAPNGACASDDALKPEHVVEEWNKVAERIARPKVRDLTPARRQLVKARIAQYSLEDFVAVFDAVEKSPFLRGERRWAGASFDWCMKAANFQKVIEGNYNG